MNVEVLNSIRWYIRQGLVKENLEPTIGFQVRHEVAPEDL